MRGSVSLPTANANKLGRRSANVDGADLRNRQKWRKERGLGGGGPSGGIVREKRLAENDSASRKIGKEHKSGANSAVNGHERR